MRRMKTCKEIQECANERQEFKLIPLSGTIKKESYIKCFTQNNIVYFIIEGQFNVTAPQGNLLKLSCILPKNITNKIYRLDGSKVSDSPTSEVGVTRTPVTYSQGIASGDNKNSIIKSESKDTLTIYIALPSSGDFFVSLRTMLSF